MDELKAIFAANLISLRGKSGMTQAELGQQIHYTDKAVSKWERAESLPDAFVLKQLAELFGVTIDDLLTDGSKWSPPPSLKTEKETFSRFFIVLCSIASIWTLCVVEFVIVWIVLDTIQWIVFIAAIPLSLIALLVFSSVWYGGKHNQYIIALLVLSIILLIYLILLHYNLWQVFIILVPAEIVVFLACNIRKGSKKVGSTVSRVLKNRRRAEKTPVEPMNLPVEPMN